jgi:hypothetical protein
MDKFLDKGFIVNGTINPFYQVCQCDFLIFP